MNDFQKRFTVSITCNDCGSTYRCDEVNVLRSLLVHYEGVDWKAQYFRACAYEFCPDCRNRKFTVIEGGK